MKNTTRKTRKTQAPVIDDATIEAQRAAALELLMPVVAPKRETKTRDTLFAQSICRVLRYCGANGYKFDNVRRAMNVLGADVADVTIKIQLNAGAKQQRGAIAQLNDEQKQQLIDAMK